MARDKGAAPSRRGPSRSGRASFEADPNANPNEGADNSPDNLDSRAAEAATVAAPTTQGSTLHESVPPSSASEDTDGDFKERGVPHAFNGVDSNSHGNASGERSNTRDANSSVAGPTSAPAVVTPRGRGRPRKKQLEPKGQDATGKSPLVSKVAEKSSAAPASAAVASTSIMRKAKQTKSSGALGVPNGNGGMGGREKASDAEEQGEGEEATGGHESDEWSEDDEVHHLPQDIKAQFGNVSKHEKYFILLSSTELNYFTE